ncbi:MAG: hypothetical protein P4M13_10835 [Alphaproteobacteria bacterium]|nr:hypothetical protein [Alphaproteobacteria bacterium]
MAAEPSSTISAVWHLGHDAPSLGNGAMLLAEAKMQGGAESFIDLIVIEEGRAFPLVLEKTLQEVRGVASIHKYAQFRQARLQKQVWPSSDESVIACHNIDTTLRLQERFLLTGARPYLQMSQTAKALAQNIISRYAADRAPITVHLKNQMGGESNAAMGVWADFIKNRRDAAFFLIGHDDVPDILKKMENVIIVSQHAPELAVHLALISAARGFLGMQSGPANFAIFSNTPYVLFKNPAHHKTEMNRELGDRNNYNFSYPWQQIWREHETLALLESAIDIILSTHAPLRHAHVR